MNMVINHIITRHWDQLHFHPVPLGGLSSEVEARCVEQPLNLAVHPIWLLQQVIWLRSFMIDSLHCILNAVMIDLLMVLEVQGLPKILTKAEIESKASEQYEGETSEKDCITYSFGAKY